MNRSMEEKIEALALMIYQAELNHLVRIKADCLANRLNCFAVTRPGKKYVKIDIGREDGSNASGKYMIDMETGAIYDIKGYGQVHKGRKYGTVDEPDLPKY